MADYRGRSLGRVGQKERQMNERAEKVQVTAHMREYWPGDWPSLNDARFFTREVVSTGLSEAICTYGYQADGKWVEIPKKYRGDK